MEQTKPTKMFAKIPKLIHKKGRAAGFEKLRDMALEDWEVLCSRMNPYSALKFAIEADRHAMFVEVAEAKKEGHYDRELWDRLSDYLHGEVNVAPDSSGVLLEVGSGRTGGGVQEESDEQRFYSGPEEGDDGAHVDPD